jgi:hypothetical protein
MKSDAVKAFAHYMAFLPMGRAAMNPGRICGVSSKVKTGIGAKSTRGAFKPSGSSCRHKYHWRSREYRSGHYVD